MKFSLVVVVFGVVRNWPRSSCICPANPFASAAWWTNSALWLDRLESKEEELESRHHTEKISEWKGKYEPLQRWLTAKAIEIKSLKDVGDDVHTVQRQLGEAKVEFISLGCWTILLLIFVIPFLCVHRGFSWVCFHITRIYIHGKFDVFQWRSLLDFIVLQC